MNVNFVDATLIVDTEPEVASSKRMYLVAFVDVSSEIVTPPPPDTVVHCGSAEVPCEVKTCPEVPNATAEPRPHAPLQLTVNRELPAPSEMIVLLEVPVIHAPVRT